MDSVSQLDKHRTPLDRRGHPSAHDDKGWSQTQLRVRQAAKYLYLGDGIAFDTRNPAYALG